MSEFVVIEGWSPWPLVFPGLVAVAGVVLSVLGTRRRSKPVREGGYVAFIVGSLAAVGMAWSMSGIWDTEARTKALASLGVTRPSYSASLNVQGNDLAPIGFTGLRGGRSIHGVLLRIDGERWEVRIDDLYEDG